MGIQKLFALRPLTVLGIYVILDIICIGMGMGVPIFCILFGFVAGWYIMMSIAARTSETREILKRAFYYSVVAASVTFLGMAIIWTRCIPILFNPNADLAHFGIPMILYEPTASFIGWLVLMIFISPFLQLLTALFSAYLTLLFVLRKSE